MHLHAATATHYDLRLQAAGALASFAVPRGPSLDPAEKRLAVRTEPHPLAYLTFEDVIPEGNYGAGPMIVWDMGVVRYLEAPVEDGLAAGKVDFWLEGYKLRGRFALVKTKAPEGQRQEHWLLIKKHDPHASERPVAEERPRSVLSGLLIDDLKRRDVLARELEQRALKAGGTPGVVQARDLVPMLCAAEGAGLEDSDRLYELKLDGVRIVAESRKGRVALRYRHGRLATRSYEDVARAIATLPGDDVVLDGEVVAFDSSGRPSFQKLSPRIAAQKPREMEQARAAVPVVYLVFDLLELQGVDLRHLPLRSRKELLAELIQGKGLVRRLDHLEGDGRRLFEFVRGQRLEGVVAKTAASPYRPGPRRSKDWVKIKAGRDDDFVVVGWFSGKGSRQQLGALELATYDEAGDLRLRGKVGSGLSDDAIDSLLPQLHGLLRSRPPYVDRPPKEPQKRHPVDPRLVVNVRYLGWSDDGRLRFPVFNGLRADVEAPSCRAAPGGEEGLGLPDDPGAVVIPRATTTRVRQTNRDKVFWPDERLTKGDLLDYYSAVSPWLLPFLAGRPTVLVRYPDGIRGKHFFQWNPPAGTPTWMRMARIRDGEHQGKHAFLVDDLDGLLHVVNLGAIPLHILASRELTPGQCDFLTLDFDIGQQPFQHAVILALEARALLDQIGLKGYPKTSGKSGLHVLVPLGPGVPFEAARILTELLGRGVTLTRPDIATMERRIDQRGGKVYVDTGQTGQSRTIVAPYSLRAHPGATVSAPVRWDELHLALDPSSFTMHAIVERLTEVEDPYAAFLDERPDIPGAVVALERHLRKTAGP